MNSDWEELRPKVTAFLDEAYGDEIQTFATAYPSETRFEVEIGELRARAPDLRTHVSNDPPGAMDAFTQSLRFHEAHEKSYLADANVVFTTSSREITPRDVRVTNKGIGKMVGRVHSVSESRDRATTLAFTCRNCGATTYEDQSGDTRREPYNCSGCGKQRVEYDINESESSWIAIQELEVEDPESILRPGEIYTAEVTLSGDAVDHVRPGDWWEFIGYPRISDIKDDLTVETEFRAHIATQTEAEDIYDFEPDFKSGMQPRQAVFPDPVEELTQQHLYGYADHVEAVLEEHGTYDINEETGKARLVTPFLELLGWSPPLHEIWMEYSNYSGSADYVLARDDDPVMVVEAKAPDDLGRHVPFKQIRSYMQSIGVQYGLLTDGLQFRFMIQTKEKTRLTTVIDAEYDILYEYVDVIGHFTRPSVIDRAEPPQWLFQ